MSKSPVNRMGCAPVSLSLHIPITAKTTFTMHAIRRTRSMPLLRKCMNLITTFRSIYFRYLFNHICNIINCGSYLNHRSTGCTIHR